MKGLDTPVLLAFLRGNPNARRLLRSLAGEELATTEWNLFELETLARAAKVKGRESRIATLEKLRRRVTVLPIDIHAVRAASREISAGTGVSGAGSASRLMIAALEANGATEWYTTKLFASLPQKGRCRVRLFEDKRPK